MLKYPVPSCIRFPTTIEDEEVTRLSFSFHMRDSEINLHEVSKDIFYRNC